KGQSSPYLDGILRHQPKAMIEIIPDTGHFPQLEKPVESNAIIERFLKGLAA
ncbi:MAG: alpha/beta hydrolase, partial [Proteobacteria bacterium]|nr:alpha/beta hydrolase [Pseudomonadota bacterium]